MGKFKDTRYDEIFEKHPKKKGEKSIITLRKFEFFGFDNIIIHRVIF